MEVQHLIAGGSTLLLSGLRQILSSGVNSRVVKVAISDGETLMKVRSYPPDFFWIELYGIEGEAMNYCRQVMGACPNLKTAVLCGDRNPKIIRQFLETGITAYLLTNCITDYIEEAIVVMAKGGVYIDPQLRNYLADQILDLDKLKRGPSPLTRREKEVLKLIIEEYTTQEIANKLYINFCTVETHRLHLIRKMGVKNTAGLVREALVRQLYSGQGVRELKY